MERVGGYWDRKRGREMSNKPLRELHPLLSLKVGEEKWGGEGGVEGQGVMMRSKPPGSCINFFSTTCVQHGMGCCGCR